MTRVASVLVLGVLLIAGGQSQSNDQQHAPWGDYAIIFVILAMVAFAWLRTGFKKLSADPLLSNEVGAHTGQLRGCNCGHRLEVRSGPLLTEMRAGPSMDQDSNGTHIQTIDFASPSPSSRTLEDRGATLSAEAIRLPTTRPYQSATNYTPAAPFSLSKSVTIER